MYKDTQILPLVIFYMLRLLKKVKSKSNQN